LCRVHKHSDPASHRTDCVSIRKFILFRGKKSLYSGNNMKHVRERRICGESAAILNIKADGM